MTPSGIAEEMGDDVTEVPGAGGAVAVTCVSRAHGEGTATPTGITEEMGVDAAEVNRVREAPPGEAN